MKHGGNIYKYNDVLDFSANINPIGMPEGVLAAYRDFYMDLFYPDPDCSLLKEKISGIYEIHRENIICSNGAVDIIYRAAYFFKTSHILVLSPTFTEYELAFGKAGAKVSRYYVNQEDFIVREDILQMLTDDIDILCLCNPNNPTGKMLEEDILDKIIKRCREKNIFIILDESFIDFTGDKSFVYKKNLTDNILVLHSFTKIYGIPGLRAGFGMCMDKNIIAGLEEAGAPWSMSGIAQRACVNALADKEWIAKTVSYVSKERDYLYSILEKAGIKYWESMANYILFKGPVGLYEDLLNEGILIRELSDFGDSYKNYYRIAVRTHEENEIFAGSLYKVIQGGLNGRDKE